MLRKHLIWQIYPPYMLVIVFSLLILTIYSSHIIREIYLEQTAVELNTQSQLLSEIVLKKLDQKQYATIQNKCIELGKQLDSRITIILPDGIVIADSHEDPQIMDNHATRPEIQQALSGNRGESTRYSYTLEKEMMYVAIPLQSETNIIGVIRAAKPVSVLSQVLSFLYKRIIIVGLVVVILAAIFNWIFTRRINRPIKEMQKGFNEYGQGNLEHRINLRHPEEFKMLADAMNHMASDLQERVNTIVLQRNELESILSSMIEGVLVVDPEDKILRINHVLLEMFDLTDYSIENIRGKHFQEVFRNSTLYQFVQNILNVKSITNSEIQFNLGNDHTLKAHGTQLRNKENENIGALIVFNDITRTVMLENVRREFVSNVSHELKTPITSIKGYVETLRDGALKDKQNAKRFLKIINKHTDRLNAIIEDLLKLSRIEQESETDQIQLEPESVKKMLLEALAVTRAYAADHKVHVELDCKSKIKMLMKFQLMSLAVSNLINNAVKYSESENIVYVKAYEDKSDVLIEVEDHGCGIPSDDIPRIFERFYRVDKARSRELGGTGLGLSIVKHVVQAHRGSVEVESEMGKGSLFRIKVPAI